MTNIQLTELHMWPVALALELGSIVHKLVGASQFSWASGPTNQTACWTNYVDNIAEWMPNLMVQVAWKINVNFRRTVKFSSGKFTKSA